jgi:hypothetical protein
VLNPTKHRKEIIMVLFRLDFSRLLSAAGVSALLLWSAPAISAQPSAFIGLGGAWSGGGTISLSDGSTEKDTMQGELPRRRRRNNYEAEPPLRE